MRTLLTAESAGFCPGVIRSVTLAERALAEYGTVWCLGELVHNSDEISRLEEMGLRVVSSPEEIPPNAVALLRAHGEGPAVYAALEAKNVKIIDTTCGKVKRVQQLARKARERGRRLLVLGDPEHPEVRGVLAWSDRGLAVPDPAALEALLKNDPSLSGDGVDLVFQTTETEKNFKYSSEIAKKWCTNCEIFDTICFATQIRQTEAVQLAKKSDAMVVVGGRNSANSRHLAQLCGEVCERVLFVENAAALDLSGLSGCDTVGLTAGASVPARILKEVKQKMDEIRETAEVTPEETSAAAEQQVPVAAPAQEAGEEREKSFAEMVEDSIRTVSNGDVVKGVVVQITGADVIVDLGTKHSGYIPVEEFEDDSGKELSEVIHVGDTVEATVVRVNDNDGTVQLSKKRLDAVKNWDDMEAAFENETVVEGIVTEENKGGIVVKVHGLRVFVPASQSGLPRDAEMSQLLRQKVQLYITEVNRARRRVVGSIRKVAAKARRENIARIWEEIEIGKHYHGVVKSLTSYGAFVDIGGVDGMVHVSELSWKRINKPSEVVSEGDEIDVYVIGFDKETRKISLGYKDPNQNPWVQFTSQYQVGDVATVRIVKLMTFGAFAEIVPGVDGLIHISQIANHRINKPEEALSVGDEVDVKITAINEEKQRISLSIRALSEPTPGPRRNSYREEEPEDYDEPVSGGSDALVYEVSEKGVSTGNAPEVDEA